MIVFCCLISSYLVSPGMQPILLSCYLSTSSSPVEANANQFPVMDIIRGGLVLITIIIIIIIIIQYKLT